MTYDHANGKFCKYSKAPCQRCAFKGNVLECAKHECPTADTE